MGRKVVFSKRIIFSVVLVLILLFTTAPLGIGEGQAETSKAQKKQSFSCAEISKIDANCDIFTIQVYESDNDNIEILWKDSKMRTLEIKRDKGVVTIQDRATIGFYGPLELIDLNAGADLVIRIPASYEGKAIFQCKGDLTISNLNTKAAIGLATSTGEILLDRVSCGKMDIRGNSGKINCYSLDATSEISISTRNGDIMCSLLRSENDYSVSYATNNRHASSRAKDSQRGSSGTAGNGSVSVLLTSERGTIDFAFQNGILVPMPSNNYDHNNAFEDW